MSLVPNSKGEKITAKAHQGPIEIEGVTVATVDDQVRLQKVETWFDPLEMFRQIAPNGIVNKEVRGSSDDRDDDHDDHDYDHEGSAGVAKDDAPEGGPKEEIGETATNKEGETGTKREESKEVKEKEDEGVVHELTKDFDQKSTLIEEDHNKNQSSPPNVESSPPPSSAAAAIVAAPTPAPASASAPADTSTNSTPSSSRGPAPAPPKEAEEGEGKGDAIATKPSDNETRRVHEEMSRITPAECPFLNQEWTSWKGRHMVYDPWSMIYWAKGVLYVRVCM